MDFLLGKELLQEFFDKEYRRQNRYHDGQRYEHPCQIHNCSRSGVSGIRELDDKGRKSGHHESQISFIASSDRFGLYCVKQLLS